MTTEERLDQLEIDAMGLRRLVNDQEARLAIANQRHDDGAGHDECLQGGTEWGQLFELYDVTDTTYKVRAAGLTNTMLLGGQQAITATSGLTYVNTGAAYTWHWASGTVSATEYVWMEVDRKTAANSKLYSGGTLTINGDAGFVEMCPLWYIPWDATNSRIDQERIVNMRTTLHVTGMM